MSPQLRSVLLLLGQAIVEAANAEVSPAPQATAPAADRWLTPAEAAQVLNVEVKWLYRRWRTLAFCHPLPGGGRGFRVSERALQRAMEGRS